MSYRPEWILATGVSLIVLLVAPPLALIAFGVLAFAALVALVALVGAIAATPYLLLRSVHRRWAQAHAGRLNAAPTSHGLEPVPSEET